MDISTLLPAHHVNPLCPHVSYDQHSPASPIPSAPYLARTLALASCHRWHVNPPAPPAGSRPLQTTPSSSTYMHAHLFIHGAVGLRRNHFGLFGIAVCRGGLMLHCNRGAFVRSGEALNGVHGHHGKETQLPCMGWTTFVFDALLQSPQKGL